MSVPEFVDGSGWISDESDFYGSVKLRAKLEKKVRIGLKRRFEMPFANTMAKRVKLDSISFASPTPSTEPELMSAYSAVPKKPQSKMLLSTDPTEIDCDLATAHGPTPPAGSVSRPKRTENVLDFLKNRPQVSSMHKMHAVDQKPTQLESSRNAAGNEADDLLDDHRFKDDPSAWQQCETVEAFLRRAPVLDSATAKLGPWLWVRNPKISFQHRKHERRTDVRGFVAAAEEKLEAYETEVAKTESTMSGKAPGTITRKLRPYREQLEDDLLSLAVKHAVTCGKWMFFPADDDLPRTWRLVAEATAAGRLGPTSKVSTKDPCDSGNVICVYTYDFTDNEDVTRVVKELNELDLVAKDGKPIYYKCDAYTYLDIKSDNPYKIRASLYSSKDVLKGEVKAKDDGPIARLKKRNGTIDTFLHS